MNWIVITIGTALVLALFAALLGPLFVDWTAYRSTIEQNAEAFLGTRVSIDGEAELRLLPSPRIRLTDVRLGSEERPLLTADSVDLDVELTPLLRGEFRVLDLRLGSPSASLIVEADGTLAVPDITIDRRFASVFRIENVTVENITIDGGRLGILDRRNGRSSTITDIDMTGDARTLRGPFTAKGTARIGGVMQEIVLGAGTLEAGTMPLSARLTPAGADVEIGFEGAVVPRPDALSMRGALEVASTGTPAWSVEGELRANTQAITLDRGKVRYGLGEAAVVLGLEGRYAIAGDEPLSLALASRHLDLDKLVRALMRDTAPADAPQWLPPSDWIDRVADHFAPAVAALDSHGGLSIPVAATLDVGAVVAGGAIVRDVSAALEAFGGGLGVERAEALLPGDTTLDLDGTLGTEGFSGNIAVSAAQPAVLARWWAGDTFPGGTMDPVFAQGDLTVGGGAVDARRLSLRIGQSSASGRVRYQRRDGAAPLLDIALAAPRLAVANLADAWAVFAASGLRPATAPDVLIDLSADEVLFGGTEGAALNLDATYRDGMLTIDALGAQDIAGTEIFAAGAIGDLFGTPVGAIDGSLRVFDGTRLASALDGFSDRIPALTRLAAAAPALAPAETRFAVSGSTDETNGSSALKLSFEGTAGGTSLDAELSAAPGPDWRAHPAAARLSARNEDGARLLAQFGIAVAGTQPAATVELDFSGIPQTSMSGTADVTALGISTRFDGDLRLAEGLEPVGSLSLEAENLGPLAAAFGRELPALAPVSLEAIVSPGEDGIELDALQGTAGGADVRGDLRASASGLTGALTLDFLDGVALAALILGNDPLPGPLAAGWSNTVFAAPLLGGIDVELALTADRLALGDTALDGATMTLSLDEDTLAISGLEGEVAGGTLSGDLTLARDGARADVSGTLALADADLAALVWQADGAPVATGRVSLAGTFATSGYAPSGLVAELAGEGTLRVGDGRIAAFDTRPLDLLNGPLSGDEPPGEERTRALLEDHLQGGDLAIDGLEATFALSGGMLRASEIAIAGGAMPVIASATIDLNTLTLRSDWALELQPADTEAVPVDITFAGPLAAPRRTIDVSALTAWLSLRHLERQVQAVEEQNQELEAEAERYAPVLPAENGPDPATDEPQAEATPSPQAGDAPTADNPDIPDTSGETATDPAGGETQAPLPPPAPPQQDTDEGASDDVERQGRLAPPWPHRGDRAHAAARAPAARAGAIKYSLADAA